MCASQSHSEGWNHDAEKGIQELFHDLTFTGGNFMVSDIVDALKAAADAFRLANPFNQRMLRGYIVCGCASFFIIFPDILAVFDVIVPVGKDWLFTIYGGALFGYGLGFVLGPGVIDFLFNVKEYVMSNRKENQADNRAQAQNNRPPNDDVKQTEPQHHRTEDDNINP
jgi:hypothetical protein